jgi:hypothetical protein
VDGRDFGDLIMSDCALTRKPEPRFETETFEYEAELLPCLQGRCWMLIIPSYSTGLESFITSLNPSKQIPGYYLKSGHGLLNKKENTEVNKKN